MPPLLLKSNLSQEAAVNMKVITISLSDKEAVAFANFLRHMYIDVYRSIALNDEDAYLMLDAGAEILQALIKQFGYFPF
jgi:hypothetical protein